MKAFSTQQELLSELNELKLQLQEANDTIDAIRTGKVDALVVQNEKGSQLYTLKTADHTYRVLIEKMKEGAVTLNHDELILYCNSQFAAMVKLPLGKVIGLPIIDFIPSESSSEFQSIIHKGWTRDSKGEIWLKNSEGELIPFLLSATALELDEGTALSVILTDLSFQKESERQLRVKNEELEQAKLTASKMNEELEDIVKERTRDLSLSREHFKFLADNIPVIVWTTKPDGAADYFNKQWYEYTGLNFEESKDAGSQQVLHPDDFETTVNAWTNAVTDKNHFQFEYRIKRAIDGEFRWHLGKGEPLKDSAGNVIAWFGTSTDIEDQKREIEKKDEFISVASHELKTPLTSLKGYVQLIEAQKDLPENIQLFISKAHGSVNKLQHLINDLLDVSKIQAGKLRFNTEALDLADVVESCIENTNHIYPSYKINKVVERGLLIRGNEERLEQVLMNLINNAVKYAPQRKEILIGAKRNHTTAIVSVKDFGIGMSTAEQRKIFDRFYRVQNNQFEIPGLGMGLFIASEIVKEHHGKMSVKSKLNEGSEFSFAIPLITSAGDETRKAST